MTSLATCSLSTRLSRTLASSLAVLVTVFFTGAASAQEGELRITEMVTARGYAAQTGASDPTTTFRRTDGRIFIVIRLENPSGAEQDITVAFERAEGTPSAGARGGVTLHVPASRRYRTVARTSTSRPAGRWRAVVRDSGGNVLQSVEFDVTE